MAKRIIKWPENINFLLYCIISWAYLVALNILSHSISIQYYLKVLTQGLFILQTDLDTLSHGHNR